MLLPHILADVAKFRHRGVLKPLALPVEMLVDLNRRFLHYGMGFLGTADEDKIIATSQPSMAIVVVEGDAQKRGRFRGWF